MYSDGIWTVSFVLLLSLSVSVRVLSFLLCTHSLLHVSNYPSVLPFCLIVSSLLNFNFYHTITFQIFNKIATSSFKARHVDFGLFFDVSAPHLSWPVCSVWFLAVSDERWPPGKTIFGQMQLISVIVISCVVCVCVGVGWKVLCGFHSLHLSEQG